MSILPLLLAAAGASVSVGLKPAADVTLPGSEIRLGDVADLSGLEPAVRASLERRVLATLPAGRSRITLSREALSSLVRRSVPGLPLRQQQGEAPLTFHAAARTERRLADGCAELGRPLAAGAILSSSDMIPVACRAGQALPELRFDRSNGVVRASSALAAGTYLGRVSAAAAPAVAKGDRLSLVATAGPVRVTREVVAMQPGRAGGKVFVRDAEGHVTSAPLALEGGAGE